MVILAHKTELQNNALHNHKPFLLSLIPHTLQLNYMLQGLIVLSVWFPFILQEGKSACQSAAYAYKVVRFFIKDYTSKTVLRARSKDDTEETGVTHP